MAREPTDDGDIKEWRSIVTLVVFVITNIIVLFPFHIPVYIPRRVWNTGHDALSRARILPPRQRQSHDPRKLPFVKRRLPVNFLTAPLVADLFLLAIGAIGREEVRDGTIGADGIKPYDIMIFFITLAYIAISIDASGLIRYMAFKVLQWGGKNGNRLFFYLYSFFFVLTSFIGNDPIILSGTAFLAYMTRVSRNIIHPRAWVFSQFAVANIASAILVSSNPTNLVLAGAFDIKFIDYTANMIVPVVITGIFLFPFLLYIIFQSTDLIPLSIEMHELPENLRNREPVNPNIPHARGAAEEKEDDPDNEEGKLLSLEEIMNPFLDKWGAFFGAGVMAVTLITILALNAASTSMKTHPEVYWVTAPAAFVMFCFDIGSGWVNRHKTRALAEAGKKQLEEAALRKEEKRAASAEATPKISPGTQLDPAAALSAPVPPPITDELSSSTELNDDKTVSIAEKATRPHPGANKANLVSLLTTFIAWLKVTFPTVMAVMSHLPFALVPFAFCMFVLVQALVTKGWVPVFAHGWDHWSRKTGIVGSIGGMGFLSVILCNFAGTNIGTTILLSRVIQSWQTIAQRNGTLISDRMFWGTVYSMAIGVNYGAFSTAFSASLAGLLWRDILARKHIHIRRLDFARVNLPIIAISMVIGLVALIGEVYVYRKEGPYRGGGM